MPTFEPSPVVSSGTAPTPGYVTNRYYMPYGIGTAADSINLLADTIRFYPFLVGTSTTFTRIGCNVTVQTVVGNLKLAIYNNSGGIPTSLVVESADITNSVAEHEATISQTLSAGWYWVAIMTDANTTFTSGFTTNSSSGIQETMGALIGADSATATISNYYIQSGNTFSGGFPSTATPTSASTAEFIRVWLRVV